MTKAKKKSNPETSAEKQFFEIINWKRAQPTMRPGPNDWMKLYTSLLEHDGFCGMDDSSRMLIVALWLYAARCGQHIFPSDPAWLARKIPMLNNKPDLGPLLAAKDICGNPTPFISYYEPPKAEKAAGKTKKQKKKIVVLEEEKRKEEKRKEKTRKEKKREEKTKSLRISEEKNRERKERISGEPANTATAQQPEALEPEKSENPIDSEAGSAKAKQHHLPKPTRSVIRHNRPQHIGAIVSQQFPDHWQDPDAESFGWEIVRALGYSDDHNNLKSRSEWGAFAAWWSKVKKSAPAIVLDELRAKAVRKAVYIRTKGKSAKNPSAVWFHIMAGELCKRGVTMTQPARASPSR